MPVRIFTTSGTTADCRQAVALIDGINAQFLLADRGYDTNEILEKAVKDGMVAAIPPKRNRLVQREYDKERYKTRHLVENSFLPLSVGGESPRDTPKQRLHLWTPFKFVASFYG